MLSSKVPSDYVLSLDTAPAEEPVTLAEAKAHCRVDFNDDDTYISSLITAATTYLEARYGVLGQALVTQTWVVSVPSYDDLGEVHIPMGPVQSITEIQYYDSDDASQTLTISDFRLVKDDWWAYIVPKPSVSWPSVSDRPDAINVKFTCGFGGAASVPAPLKQAILLHVAHMYENREAVGVGTSFTPVPMAYDAMIAPFKRFVA